MNSILRRRSIRQYTEQKIQNADIKKILEAAMSAPSAGNEQPWHFLIIEDTQTLDRLSRTHRHSAMVKHAAVAIVVCGDLSREIKKDMWVQDCAAATENILIEVEELKLGAVWVAVYPRVERVEYVRKLFGLPENIVPMSIVPIGYPAEQFETSSRYDKSRVHYETW
jgi:nitroreductase